MDALSPRHDTTNLPPGQAPKGREFKFSFAVPPGKVQSQLRHSDEQNS
jgi:hypothetical protein